MLAAFAIEGQDKWRNLGFAALFFIVSWRCSEPMQAQVVPQGGWDAKKRPLWVTGGAAGTDENSDVCAADPVMAILCDK